MPGWPDGTSECAGYGRAECRISLDPGMEPRYVLEPQLAATAAVTRLADFLTGSCVRAFDPAGFLGRRIRLQLLTGGWDLRGSAPLVSRLLLR